MFSLKTIILLLTLFTTSILSVPLPTPRNGNNVGVIGKTGISITQHHKRELEDISSTTPLDQQKRSPEPSNVGVNGTPSLPFGITRFVHVEEKRSPEASNTGVNGIPSLPFGITRVVEEKRDPSAFDPVGISGTPDLTFGITEDK